MYHTTMETNDLPNIVNFFGSLEKTFFLKLHSFKAIKETKCKLIDFGKNNFWNRGCHI